MRFYRRSRLKTIVTLIAVVSVYFLVYNRFFESDEGLRDEELQIDKRSSRNDEVLPDADSRNQPLVQIPAVDDGELNPGERRFTGRPYLMEDVSSVL